MRRPLLVCGAGRAFERLYAPAIARSPHFRLARIVEPNADRAVWAGERFDVPAYTQLQPSLEGSAPAAALAPAPPHAQAGLTHRLLDAGVAVLVEKPGVSSPRELESMPPGLLRLAQTRRFWRRYQALRRRCRTTPPSSWSIEIATSLEDWDPIDPPQDEFAALVEDLVSHAFDIARGVLNAELGGPLRLNRTGGGIALHFASGVMSVRRAERWHEMVRAEWDGDAMVVGPRSMLPAALLARAGLQPSEPVEATGRLLAAFARDLERGYTKASPAELAEFLERVRLALAQQAGSLG